MNRQCVALGSRGTSGVGWRLSSLQATVVAAAALPSILNASRSSALRTNAASGQVSLTVFAASHRMIGARSSGGGPAFADSPGPRVFAGPLRLDGRFFGALQSGVPTRRPPPATRGTTPRRDRGR